MSIRTPSRKNDEAQVKRKTSSSSGRRHLKLVSTADSSVSEAPIVERRREVPLSLRERYEDIVFVGQGGMGTVYKAYDRAAARTVALKLLRDDDPELARRLLIEARAQGRIDHARVCRIYDVGEADGEPFICMQYVDGEPLSRMAKTLTLEQRVEVIRAVAIAVQEAHRIGIVHRDIKPGNILLERRDDGAAEPFIMDFGLAREVTSSGGGQTSTGSLLGTPAYMAPEQALGDLQAIDRRTDVWGLGATLYELLAERPPFVADHPWRLLIMITSEEPTPLRVVRPSLPRDLETIAMKCLERDPSRRYDSARALADDLGRFLAGEPIAARPASIGYVLLKKSRKHKLAVSLIAIALVSSLVILGVWINGRRNSEARAHLAAELGKDITEIELFLRSAKQMPLHDIEQERLVVREKLKLIEARVAAAGPLGEGPGQFALGRAHLALEEPEKAFGHLQRAVAAGQTGPELEYALGLAMIQDYQRIRRLADRIDDEVARNARLAEVEARIKKEGLAHLRAALPSKMQVPAYVEGLLAYSGGSFEVALAKGHEAFDKAPWLYEAKRLEGQALHALAGDEWTKTLPGWYDRFQNHVRAASDAFNVAQDMGRSDAHVHRAACALWTRAMFAANYEQKPTRPDFERGKVACGRAVQADSADMLAPADLAMLHALFAYATAFNPHGADPPLAEIDDAIKLGEIAVAKGIERPAANEALGTALRARIIHANAVGRDARAAIDRARDVYESMRRTYPRHVPAYDSSLHLEQLAAVQDRFRGEDIAPRVEGALKILAGARERKIINAAMLGRTALLLMHQARQLISRGKDPALAFDRVAGFLTEGEVMTGDAGAFLEYRIEGGVIEAEYAMSSGADPRSKLEEAALADQRYRQTTPDDAQEQRIHVWLYVAQAEFAVHQNRDPASEVALARVALQRLAVSAPWNLNYDILRSRAAMLEIRWALKQGKANAAMFDAALAPLTPHLDEPIDNPEFDAMVADLHAERAAFFLERKETPDEDIRKGILHADRALEKNPKHASALATKGRLWLAKARVVREGPSAKEAARKALDAFESAIRENPLLRGAIAEQMKQTQTFL